MPDTETLASLSYGFIASAMVVYSLAMLGFAAELAFGRRYLGARLAAAAASAEDARLPANAGSGGVAVLEQAPPIVGGDGTIGADRAERVGRIAMALTILGFASHFAGLLTRGAAAGRVPWSNMYEFASAGAFVAMGVFLGLVALKQNVRWLGLFVVTPVLLTVGLAVTVLYNDVTELMPALQSPWLVIHVVAAVIASGMITVGSVVTGLYLWSARRERQGRGAAYVGTRALPASRAIDQLAYRIYAFAFPIWTFAVIAGAIWAENAWNRYWDWDPKEVWSFITWVVFAAYLHARATAGWKGNRAAIIALVGFLCLLFNFIGVNFWVVGLHSYA